MQKSDLATYRRWEQKLESWFSLNKKGSGLKISQYFRFEKRRKKQNKTYRIIGQKAEDPNRISVNSNVIPTLIYNEATARFHQWRAQGTVYGLNFASTDQVSDFLQNSDRKKHLPWLLQIRSPEKYQETKDK